jgi:hypothetical protein
MMSATQFRKRTNIFMHRRKSPIIQDIDKLLQEYETTSSENRKMKCLVYIYMMCKHYLHTKPQGRRRGGVRDLMDEVKAILDSPAFKRQIAAKAGGRHYSDGKVTDLMSTPGSTATSLSPGYLYESILPQKNFIAKMSLNMESLLGDQKYFSASDLNDGDRHMNLSQDAFSQILDRLYQLWIGDDTRAFLYLNEQQRLQYAVVIRDGRLYQYGANTLLHTGIEAQVGWEHSSGVYAMDTDERLYSTPTITDIIPWNHSSLLSGHPVVCAGLLWADQGRLLRISNASGHYRPDSRNLADCVRVLCNAGLNPYSFEVKDEATGTLYQPAMQFLAAYP